MTTDHLQLNYFFPWSLILALILALAFAAMGILIYRKATTHVEEEIPVKKESPWVDKIQNFLARFGFFGTDPLSQSFGYALKLMYDFIGGTQFRYQLPWIITLGSQSTGKSTLLESLSLDRPIGRPLFEVEGGEKPLCDWWFFDHGTVLDLDGKLVLNASQPLSDEDNWKLFLNLLARHRPKRPMDGVILTIPASELIGKTALSHDDIMIRAEYLYEKLWQMQHLTGIRVPVYVVVTKCDFVPGFESFCKSLPSHNGRDMFGWSNDHAINITYEGEWIDEAFSSINDALYRVQEEIYADGDATTVDGRDGVFLFPLAFNQLKGGVKTYCNHLFKPSGYHESFFLRGIYFVGDSQIEKLTPEADFSLNLSASSSPTTTNEKRNIYFADNLFEYKIFREVGLARPVSRTLLGNTTIMRFAKVAVAVIVIVGTLGLLRANESLQKAKVNLVPALTQIEVILDKLRGKSEETEIGREFFDDQAQVLLNTMTQISVSRLGSVFIPPSWYDDLDARIKYVMGLAYDHVILRSMASQLDYKASQLFSLQTFVPVTEKGEYGIDPLQTTEFFRLKNYVLAVRALELAANKFNELGVSTNLNDVAEIIKYLFNYDMPKAFYENTSYYIDALKRTSIKLFDFNAHQEFAIIKLRKLFDEFEIAAFDPDKMIPGIGRLMTDLNEFEGVRNYAAYDEDLLRNAFESLKMTISSIENPGLQWINADHFNPGPQYEYIMELIVGSNFFTITVAKELTEEVDHNLFNFRKRLASYKSPLFKGGNLFITENDIAVAQPSEGALGLEKNLDSFFSETFMAETEAKTIITAIPIGSVLLWDTLRLQEAVALVKLYNDFVNSRLLNLPKALQPMLQKIAREGLTKNLVRYIADAEIFSSGPTTGSLLSPEDALLSQVQNYRAATPYLEQILLALKANNANDAFSTLKSLLTTQAYNPLKKLDSILSDESPYAIKDNSFDWWTGQNLAALEAYGVSNLTELKNYLELQRGRINYLAREFAEPLVSLLDQVNKEGMPGNLPLVTKWAAIISVLSGYEQKSPGNGLVELEDYIMNTLNEVTLATCQKYASTVSMISANQDFFVSILVDLQEKLHKRCTSLSGYVSADNYTKLAEFFNANLAGRFPFTETADQSLPDASPEDIRTFFEMMGTQSQNVKATLKQATNLGAAGKNALAFIEQVENVKDFFGDYLAPNSTLPYPSFTYDITFRVNKDREVRANEILKWEFTSENSTVTMRSPSRKGYWKVGNPVTLSLVWALNSPLQPVAEEGNPNLNIQGEDANFSYEGTWALLRLLRQHQASPSDFDTLKDASPTTLRFDVPLTNILSNAGKSTTGDLPKATVFVQIEVAPVPQAKKKETTAPQKGSKTSAQEKVRMGKPVRLPYFPFCAPKLSAPEN